MFAGNDIFGCSLLKNVTAAECAGGEAVFYCRNRQGRVWTEKMPFRPFVLTASADVVAGFPDTGNVEITELEGKGYWHFMISFASVEKWREFNEWAGKNKIPFWQWRDLRTQALTQCGVRSFDGMDFKDLKRMSIAVECTEKGAVSCIECAVSDGSRKNFEIADYNSEHDLLKDFTAYFREEDCDVLEGFEISREILPLLQKRAKTTRVELSLGRDGSAPVSRASRFALPDMQINYKRWEIAGRQVIDQWMLCAFYDAVKRVLEDNTVAAAAEHFGITAGNSAEKAAAISEILLPSYFYQTVFLPMTLQEVIARGNGSTVDALMVSGYIKRKHSLPLPDSAVRYPGALVGMETSGVIKNVWHCDVRSLYPSILAAGQLAPEKDTLKIFPALISSLRRMRLQARDMALKAGDPEEKRRLDVMQKVFKITINSFYGYLGFAQGVFNDFALAAEVTAAGREILNNICDFLQKTGASIIEKDTDGVYFSPPDNAISPADFQHSIQEILPEGIDIEIDAVYKAMFSYKSKNYALLSEDGTVEISGAALKSRGMEPFLRNFIRKMIQALLENRGNSLPEIKKELENAVNNRALPLAEMAKSEKLSDSPDNYRKKMEAGTGRRSAAYEIALASSRKYRTGDSVAFYLTGSKPKPSVVEAAKELPEFEPDAENRDENIPAYLRKINDIYDNFREFIQ